MTCDAVDPHEWVARRADIQSRASTDQGAGGRQWRWFSTIHSD